MPRKILLNGMCALAMSLVVTITQDTPDSFCSVLFFILDITDNSKKTTSENSENQFLVIVYWYTNNIGEINLIELLVYIHSKTIIQGFKNRKTVSRRHVVVTSHGRRIETLPY